MLVLTKLNNFNIYNKTIMGLLTKLTSEGSTFTAYDGATPTINPLATKYSPLHADIDRPGYSLNGSFASQVINNYNEYLDGVNNSIPQPSQLDIDGQVPTISASGKQKLPYLDNLPE
jgi:hypothetical protein